MATPPVTAPAPPTLESTAAIRPPAIQAFDGREDLVKYGSNALMLFAVQLRYQIEDVDTFASSFLTDGTDDKKCDLIWVDRELRLALVCQSYRAANETRSQAPANKAADLNTGIAWVLCQPLEEVPDRIRSAVKELRSAISEGKIDRLVFWYVHNLPESDAVRKELSAVEQTARAALTTHFGGSEVTISAEEVGRGTIDEFYQRLQTKILVTDTLDLDVPGGTEVRGGKWRAYSTAVPVTWLFGLFTTYKERLFSANVRDYLGSRKSDTNINNGIKTTASSEPENFWVFNNGITALVNSLDVQNDGQHI